MAILDRFLHHSEIIQITRRSLSVGQPPDGITRDQSPHPVRHRYRDHRQRATETNSIQNHPKGPNGYCLELPSPVLFQAPADTRRDLHSTTLHSLARIQRRKHHVPP